MLSVLEYASTKISEGKKKPHLTNLPNKQKPLTKQTNKTSTWKGSLEISEIRFKLPKKGKEAKSHILAKKQLHLSQRKTVRLCDKSSSAQHTKEHRETTEGEG